LEKFGKIFCKTYFARDPAAAKHWKVNGGSLESRSSPTTQEKYKDKIVRKKR
jgi:hypothetical protein